MKMYCGISPSVGLVPIRPATSQRHPNYNETAGVQEAAYYGMTPCQGLPITGSYQLQAKLNYEMYSAYLQYHSVGLNCSARNEHCGWEPSYNSSCYTTSEHNRLLFQPNVKCPSVNPEIPLKNFAKQNEKGNRIFVNEYRDPTNSSTDESMSRTSSSVVFMSSKESSPYSSSSESGNGERDSRGSHKSEENANKFAQRKIRHVLAVNAVKSIEESKSAYIHSVRPRIRPEKPKRKNPPSAQILPHESYNAQKSETPGCGLMAHKKSKESSVQSTVPHNVNCHDAMEVDELAIPFRGMLSKKQHGNQNVRICNANKKTRNLGTKYTQAFPIKQHIQKFERLADSIKTKDCIPDNKKRDHRQHNRCKASTCQKQDELNGNPSRRNINFESQHLTSENLKTKITNTENCKRDSRKMFLGLYEVESVLGVGGGGKVYAGIRVTDSKPIALKRIMREKIKRWEKYQGRQIPQEIVLMMKVNGHRNVIRLLDWYECLDSFILILERPPNCIDLFDYIRDVGRMTEEEGAFMFKQIIEAVRHIHSKGVLHRDIKDENVVINRDNKIPKIIDFGCGTRLFDGVYKDFSGTPEFYPPEWFSKHEYRGRSAATWSLGILLYDMLCGEIPFKTSGKIVSNVLTFKAPISQNAKHLIMWMLCSDADVRPDLDDILQHPWMQQNKY